MSQTEKTWTRIEAWLEINRPNVLEGLGPGATDEEVRELQESLALDLPESFNESLKRHNGESGEWPNTLFGETGRYLSTSAIVDTWKMRTQVSEEVGEPLPFGSSEYKQLVENSDINVVGPVKPHLFSPAWVSFVESGLNTFLALDFDPDDGGDIGQVIAVDIEGESWRVISGSFGEFLEAHLGALEGGKVDFGDEYADLAIGSLINVEEQRKSQNIERQFASATTAKEIGELPPGSEVELVGYRHGSVEGDIYEFCIVDDIVVLKGSLRGAQFRQALRVRVRTGEKPARRHDDSIHEVIEWEVVDDG